MQIRLTVLAPHGGSGARRACDVVVTSPSGTALAAVASALATAASGADTAGPVIVYSGGNRLDPQRCVLGEPPLLDGAVVSLQAPGDAGAPESGAPAQLRVVAGPDAGGVHLLHGGMIRIGRSAEADVPLDDPDVSRLHCAVSVGADGSVSVMDLGSTNGTVLAGADIGREPVPLPPGAPLRLGESTIVLARGGTRAPLATAADGEGHLRVSLPGGDGQAAGRARPAAAQASFGGPAEVGAARGPGASAETHGRGAAPGAGAFGGQVPVQRSGAEPYGQGGAPGRHGVADPYAQGGSPAHGRAAAGEGGGPQEQAGAHGSPRPGEAAAARDNGPAARRRGLGAWARRAARGSWAGGLPGEDGAEQPQGAPGVPGAPGGAPGVSYDAWPDSAEVLLTALGPGPRLWERGRGHAQAMVARLGTADRADGRQDQLPAPVTVDLREAGSLGLAGPRERLRGLAASVVAQLAALHAPSDLSVVLVTTDRRIGVDQRRQEWSWLGWLPHVRPAHGQNCRLLLAFDKEQAAARTGELARRLDEGPLGPGWASADPASIAEASRRHTGSRVLLIVDGDPGSAALRETTARLAGAGPAAGVHVLCLAETPAASALSPVTATYEMACAASLPFRECGAFALLSGDVAGALRLLRAGAAGGPIGDGGGQVAVVDAVSAAWAERFGRALAPLRTTGVPAGPGPLVSLPRSARLLDELGLARATPVSLLARWASAADRADDSCAVVLGAGPRGAVGADLVREGPHLLIEGPTGSGRTELLRAVAASLAAGSRPDRLGLLLVEGAGGMRGDGLAAATELPHVTEYLVASDPVRMREFAQALGAELKRRAELLGTMDFAEWHQARAVAQRMVGPRSPGDGGSDAGLSQTRTLRLRPSAVRPAQEPPEPDPLPRLVVLVDDFDALVDPALGSPGRPAAPSVVRALEAVARDGERLGVHLVAAAVSSERTRGTDLARIARLRAVLDALPLEPGPEDPAPGRGRLAHADGSVVPFQAGRVTGRIPRTGTSRPTVLPLEWERMGDPPTRRPVRELGNGPTDLALLASALDRAARSVAAVPVQPLAPARP
jgi:FHA domain/FtsK/SpoIIIE family